MKLIYCPVLMIMLALGLRLDAQVATGKPPLGTFSGAPDVINLGNLNSHLEISIIHKPGRGMPFDYILSFDDSVWTPTSINGTLTWQPTANWGWRAITEAVVGYITYSTITIQCPIDGTMPPRYYHTTQKYNYQYHDQFGVTHNFDNIVGGCPGDYDPADTVSTDASGLTLHTGGAPLITAPDGTNFSPPVGGSSGGGTRTDRNGNQITTTSGSTFVDTLGATVLSVSGTAPNPVIFTYTTSTNTSAQVTMNYAAYNVKTNFACSGVAEYNAPASLVSNIVLPDNTQYSFTYESTPGSSGYVTGRVASITLPTGGTVNYQYSGGSNGIICADGSNAGLTRTLTHSGITDSTTTYTRSGSGSNWSTTITDGLTPLPNQQVITFQTTRTPALFLETSRSIYNGYSWNTLIQRTDTCYNGVVPPCTNTAVSLPIRELDRYVTLDNGQQSFAKAVLNTFGLPLEVDEYDYGSPTHGALMRKSMITYAPLGNGVAGLPQSIIVQDGSGNQLSSTTYNYDEAAPSPTSGVPQHVTVTGSRGNLTSISRWLNLPTVKTVVNTFTYEDTGNLLASTDPGQHATTFSYSDTFSDGNNTRNTRAYITQVTGPDTNSPTLAHHVSALQYDFNTGLITRTTDENSQQTSFTYDSMNRPTQVSFADGGQTTTSYLTGNQVVVQSKLDATPRWTYSSTMLDSFGRISRTIQANAETAPYDLQDFCYDANGRLKFRSYPYQANNYTGAGCTTPGDTFSYDGAGRLVSLTHSDGSSVSYGFTGRAVQITGEGNGSFNVSRIQQADALGRLTKVCEVSSTTLPFGSGSTPASCGLDLPGIGIISGFLTSYGYDALGRITSMAQGPQPARTYSYDSLGRLRSESHPEWTSLPASQGASTSYTYNDDGLPVSRVRPSPNQADGSANGPKVTTTYAYDEAHRLRSRTYSDSTPAATFNYDENSPLGQTAALTLGRLTSEDVGNAKAAFSYDALGRVVKNWQCTPYTCPGIFKLVTYQYDFSGNVTQLNNGAGVTFTYTYNTAPRLTQITSNYVDANHPATLLSNVHYGVYGPSGDLLGNGLAEAFAYNVYGAIQSYTSAPYNFSLTFAPDWSVTAATDSLNGNWTYAYDEFNRLASSSKNLGAQTFNYKYDRYGNRWQQNAPQGGPQTQYTFDDNNHISNLGVTYDALGNMTNDGLGNSYSYDAENRLVQVINAGGTSTYVYDAEGRRVRTANSDYTYDLAGRPLSLFGVTNGVPNYEMIYAGGRHLGTYSMGTTSFMHADWLGTKRVMTTVSGANAVTCTSLPFGDALNCAGNDRDFSHFTDDVHDSESNLEHTWFRQYSTTQGRFATADPYAGSMDMENPQSLNRYGYVSNYPMNDLDDSGLDARGGGLGPASGGAGGLYPANCTLYGGTDGEVFFCVNFGPSSGGRGGFGFGLLGPGVGGGGFGGVTLPGCLLPGACSITLPTKSIWDLLPQLPSDECAGKDWCVPGSETGNGFLYGQGTNPDYTCIEMGPCWEADVNQNLIGHYCGPGGGGDTTGKLDIACKAHDDCYTQNGLSITDNWKPTMIFPSKKAYALQACNQQLCDAAAQSGDPRALAVIGYFQTFSFRSCRAPSAKL